MRVIIRWKDTARVTCLPYSCFKEMVIIDGDKIEVKDYDEALLTQLERKKYALVIDKTKHQKVPEESFIIPPAILPLSRLELKKLGIGGEIL